MRQVSKHEVNSTPLQAIPGKRFVRYQEGADMYSMSLSKFTRMAKAAGAIYKINRMVLVNCEVFDRFLESVVGSA